MGMSCLDCHDYMDGYNCGKKEGLIEELKKIKNRIIDEINQRTQISAYIDIVTGLEISLRFIDERISELKGENK